MAGLRKGTTPHARADGAGLDLLALARSFGYAFEGLCTAWRRDQNFRVEALIGIAALALALWLGVGLAPILLCSALVLGLELVNSALEAVVDLASPTVHPLAKRAKDLAAGAVLLASLNAVVVGLVVMGPPLWQRLFGG